MNKFKFFLVPTLLLGLFLVVTPVFGQQKPVSALTQNFVAQVSDILKQIAAILTDIQTSVDTAEVAPVKKTQPAPVPPSPVLLTPKAVSITQQTQDTVSPSIEEVEFYKAMTDSYRYQIQSFKTNIQSPLPTAGSIAPAPPAPPKQVVPSKRTHLFFVEEKGSTTVTRDFIEVVFDRTSLTIAKNVISSEPTTFSYGDLLDSTLDRRDRHHLVYVNGKGQAIYRLGSVTEIIPAPVGATSSAPMKVNAVAIAVDAGNYPFVAAIGEGGQQIFVAKKTVSGWTNSRAFVPKKPLRNRISLILDPTNNYNYHIFYSDFAEIRELVIDTTFALLKDEALVSYGPAAVNIHGFDIDEPTYGAGDAAVALGVYKYVTYTTDADYYKQNSTPSPILIKSSIITNNPQITALGPFSWVVMPTVAQNNLFNLTLFTSSNSGFNWSSKNIVTNLSNYFDTSGPLDIDFGETWGGLHLAYYDRDYAKGLGLLNAVYTENVIQANWQNVNLYKSTDNSARIIGLRIQGE